MSVTVRVPARDEIRFHLMERAFHDGEYGKVRDHYFLPADKNLHEFDPLEKAIRIRLKERRAELSYNEFKTKRLGYEHYKVVLFEGTKSKAFYLAKNLGFEEWGSVQHSSNHYNLKIKGRKVDILFEEFSEMGSMLKLESKRPEALKELLRQMGASSKEIISKNSVRLLAESLGIV